ncbi:MAG: FAD:protein FMN transferase [Candidatus Latescibacterota bacterium]
MDIPVSHILRNIWKRGLILAVLLLVLAVSWVLFGGWFSAPQAVESTEFHMNTNISIKVFAANREKGNLLLRKAFDEIARIEHVLEPLKGDGDLKRINAGHSSVWWDMNPDLKAVLTRSLYFYQIDDRVFDPTIGSVKWLWDFENGGKIPDPASLSKALKTVDLSKVEIQGNRLRLTVPGINLDFGGVAKGYAVDRMAAILKQGGAISGLVNAGGNIVTFGKKPGKFSFLGMKNAEKDWIIGVRHPRKEGAILVEPAPYSAVATSGDYERFFIKDGIRYHHILDPKTGQPSRESISATVWTTSAMDADILSTTMFILGPVKGVEFARKLGNVETLIFFEKDGRIGAAMSPGLAGRVKL